MQDDGLLGRLVDVLLFVPVEDKTPVRVRVAHPQQPCPGDGRQTNVAWPGYLNELFARPHLRRACDWRQLAFPAAILQDYRGGRRFEHKLNSRKKAQEAQKSLWLCAFCAFLRLFPRPLV